MKSPLAPRAAKNHPGVVRVNSYERIVDSVCRVAPSLRPRVRGEGATLLAQTRGCAPAHRSARTLHPQSRVGRPLGNTSSRSCGLQYPGMLASEQNQSIKSVMGEPRGAALIIDDDAAICIVLSALLSQIGVHCHTVCSAADGLRMLRSERIDLVVTDLRMPEINGLELLREVTANWPEIPVIMLTAHGSIPLAVEAMKAGASDFLQKPFEREEVIFVVEKALATAARQPPSSPRHELGILGESPVIRNLRTIIAKAASSSATVLIQGETGTGKELVARAIHESSPRRQGPFIRINSAAIPDNLLESELFGYEKGAFTGASARKPGRLELADGGTLFLDEIADLPLAMQAKVLRAIQEHEFERLGATRSTKVDVRFIAATHRYLPGLVTSGRFREDLYYRLNVIPIDVPPLRERAEDIELLAQSFTGRAARTNGCALVEFQRDALELLRTQAWPGNVRQLENFIERVVVMSDTPLISRAQLEIEFNRDAERARASSVGAATPAMLSLTEDRRNAERVSIENALSRAGNNRSLAARLLGISRRTLYKKLDELGLA